MVSSCRRPPIRAATLRSRQRPGVTYLRYGCAIDISNHPTRDDYRILVPISKGLQAIIGNATVSCAPGTALITSPAHSKLVHLERDSSILNLFLKGAELHRQLAALLGDTPTKPLEFAPTLDVTAGANRSLWQHVLTALDDVEQIGSLLLNRFGSSLFEQFIIMALLQSQRHNHSDALQRRERPVAPRSVRRAVDYMQANLDSPITIADLVAASGVAEQTLWQHFRSAAGTMPMRYLRDARLARVREALCRAEFDESVSSIAMSWGFTHMGRFSAQYRQRFGETPSETIRRRR